MQAMTASSKQTDAAITPLAMIKWAGCFMTTIKWLVSEPSLALAVCEQLLSSCPVETDEIQSRSFVARTRRLPNLRSLRRRRLEHQSLVGDSSG